MSAVPFGVGQDALEDVLNANAGRDYTVTRGDSPASIAKKFGVTLDQLLNANPQKATTYVKGVRTWTDLSINEGLNMPKAGVRVGYVTGVGDDAAAVAALSGKDPCARENVHLVCATQQALGFPPDGKWGTDTSIAAQAFDPNAPAGCNPRPLWWAPPGRSNCSREIIEASKAIEELNAWKRAREGSGTMSGIRFNGAPISGLGLGQDPAPQGTPTAAPPVVPATTTDTSATAPHTWSAWWHHLSTPAKVGVAALPVAAVAGGVYLATRKKGRGKRRSRR